MRPAKLALERSFRWRCSLLLILLSTELIAITARYERPTLTSKLAKQAVGIPWLFDSADEIWRLGLWVSGACLVLLSPQVGLILNAFARHTQGYRASGWLIGHFLALSAFVALTAGLFEPLADPAHLSAAGFVVWSALAAMTWVLWLLAFAPGRCWLGLLRREGWSLFIGVLLGIGAWTLVKMFVKQEAPLAQQELWTVLSDLTLRLVHVLLGLGYSDLIYRPEATVVGTATFSVRVSYACSGIEGIALIVLFLSFYCWLFRKELRFPEAFWLFPLGALAIWLANGVRIAALVAIGTSLSPEVALGGFHAEAGWVAFTLVALGAIALSHRLRFFTAAQAETPAAARSDTLAPALLVPLMVTVAASMATSAFSATFDVLYPLRVLAAAGALGYFRRRYRGLGWSVSWHAAAMGAGVFVVWLLLNPAPDVSTTALVEGLRELPNGAASGWLVFRTLGSVITVPLAEELAFRGYLLRKLVASDYERVPFQHFTWASFAVSSIAFGMLHGERWFAGTIAGMAFAWALYRRGQLGDAVVAHATANGLLSLWVLTRGRWDLWS